MSEARSFHTFGSGDTGQSIAVEERNHITRNLISAEKNLGEAWGKLNTLKTRLGKILVEDTPEPKTSIPHPPQSELGLFASSISDETYLLARAIEKITSRVDV